MLNDATVSNMSMLKKISEPLLSLPSALSQPEEINNISNTKSQLIHLTGRFGSVDQTREVLGPPPDPGVKASWTLVSQVHSLQCLTTLSPLSQQYSWVSSFKADVFAEGTVV